MTNKEETNWGFLLTLLCIIATCWMMCFLGVYIDRQAKRIDYLEIENIKHREALYLLQPHTKPEVKAGTSWRGKEH